MFEIIRVGSKLRKNVLCQWHLSFQTQKVLLRSTTSSGAKHTAHSRVRDLDDSRYENSSRSHVNE